LDAIQTSAEEVPGLPTYDELRKWMVEHDTIEKETEIFDTGELAKLRQLTKGKPPYDAPSVASLGFAYPFH
jgi:hypothetical protein